MAENRELLTVDGVVLPPPSKYEWGLMDISAAESGRNDKGRMNKARVTQKRKITAEWIMQKPDVVSKILKAVNPEYINARYFDAMENDWLTKEFYVGDRTAPVKFFWEGHEYFEKVGFELIER